MAKRIYNMVWEHPQKVFIRRSEVAKSAKKAKNKMVDWLREEAYFDANIDTISITSTMLLGRELSWMKHD